MTRAIALALLLAFAASEASAASCVDGSTCLCDTVSGGGSTVLFCEDFEAAALNDGDTEVYNDIYVSTYGPNAKWGDGWQQKYGPTSDDCMDSLPNGLGIKARGAEGRHSWSCFDVVQSDSCWGGAGYSGCVADGNSSLQFKLAPGKADSQAGHYYFTGAKQRNLGITMLIRWAPNYYSPHDGGGPANKMIEWGEADLAFLGASTGNAGATQTPFGAGLKTLSGNPGASATVSLGQVEWDGSSGYRWDAETGTYTFQADKWRCFQIKWTNFGLSNARIEEWVDTTKVVDISNLDLTLLNGLAAGDKDGIKGLFWNNYYNGTDGLGSGYAGATDSGVSYDNLVITNGDPVSCSAVHWNSDGGLGAPGVPFVPFYR